MSKIIFALCASAVTVLAAAAIATTIGSGSTTEDTATSQDVEAMGRMLASENPSGTPRLWVEQCWTQLRSRKKQQSLYQRITAGQGWGAQNSKRPVSTDKPATTIALMIARLVLLGAELSQLSGARKFFEPAQQDQAFRVAIQARAKLALGESLTAQERRLLGYQSDAAGIRLKWSSEGSKYIGTVEGVEFWT